MSSPTPSCVYIPGVIATDEVFSSYFHPGTNQTLKIVKGWDETHHYYHIARNFRGRKLSRIADFTEKTFVDSSLVPRQRMPHLQISRRKLSRIATNPQNLRKFSYSKVSRYTVMCVVSLCSGSLLHTQKLCRCGYKCRRDVCGIQKFVYVLVSYNQEEAPVINCRYWIELSG